VLEDPDHLDFTAATIMEKLLRFVLLGASVFADSFCHSFSPLTQIINGRRSFTWILSIWYCTFCSEPLTQDGFPELSSVRHHKNTKVSW